MTLDEFLKLPGAKVHDGGPCPVEPGNKPGVLFRDEGYLDAGLVQAAEWADGHDSWQHKGPSRHHIIAYREVQP